MLSYRHAFHAGNHADVLKHLAEVLVLDYLRESKPGKPLRYIDTHAGPGSYALREGYAARNREYESGIGPLWQRADLPPPLARYREVIRRFNSADPLGADPLGADPLGADPSGAEAPAIYPGSPAIARQLLRPADRLELFELHSGEIEALRQWSRGDRRVRVSGTDGLEALARLLPPLERRALIMIDPPYELKTDYTAVPLRLQAALQRFATGVYLLWYPLLGHPEAHAMVQTLQSLPVKSLRAELQVKAADSGGLYGSGVFIINPPWVLEEQLAPCLEYLGQRLGQDRQARVSLQSHGLA